MIWVSMGNDVGLQIQTLNLTEDATTGSNSARIHQNVFDQVDVDLVARESGQLAYARGKLQHRSPLLGSIDGYQQGWAVAAAPARAKRSRKPPYFCHVPPVGFQFFPVAL
jgi:hypothetical protein